VADQRLPIDFIGALVPLEIVRFDSAAFQVIALQLLPQNVDLRLTGLDTSCGSLHRCRLGEDHRT
jgi:hypothetical protein